MQEYRTPSMAYVESRKIVKSLTKKVLVQVAILALCIVNLYFMVDIANFGSITDYVMAALIFAQVVALGIGLTSWVSVRRSSARIREYCIRHEEDRNRALGIKH